MVTDRYKFDTIVDAVQALAGTDNVDDVHLRRMAKDPNMANEVAQSILTAYEQSVERSKKAYSHRTSQLMASISRLSLQTSTTDILRKHNITLVRHLNCDQTWKAGRVPGIGQDQIVEIMTALLNFGFTLD